MADSRKTKRNKRLAALNDKAISALKLLLDSTDPQTLLAAIDRLMSLQRRIDRLEAKATATLLTKPLTPEDLNEEFEL